jgi:hypothetical protein
MSQRSQLAIYMHSEKSSFALLFVFLHIFHCFRLNRKSIRKKQNPFMLLETVLHDTITLSYLLTSHLAGISLVCLDQSHTKRAHH